MPIGARAIGMGGTFTSVADNATAIYWNPSGLAAVNWREVSMSHQLLYQGLRLSQVCYAHPMSKGLTVAAGLVYWGAGSLDARDERDVPTGSFDISDMALTAGVGWKLLPELYVGGNVKAIQETIQDEKGTTAAADVGGLYQYYLEDQTVYAGLAVKDVGGKIGPGQKSDLPSSVHASVSDRLFNETIIVSSEAELYNDVAWKGQAGAEFFLPGSVSLRVGYRFRENNVSGIEGLTAGFGFIYSQSQDYVIDYAYAGQGDLGTAHHISLSLRF